MPTLYRHRALSAFVSIVCLAGCEAAKSANPTAPSVAGPIPGVSITAPKLLEPGAGSTLVYDGQPPTLLIENAGSSGSRTIWLQLEVASDSGIQQIVHQADQITPGTNGRTSYRLPAPLGAGFTYYWRTRAVDGANIGPYSTVSSFSVVKPVEIVAPIANAPNGTLTTNKPDFKVTNGVISGTTGVAYRFEVSKTSDFAQIAAVVTVPVNGSGSTTMSLGELPYKTTYFWRVKGSDGTNESTYSNTLSFTTMDAPPPPTAPTSPGQSVDASQWSTEQWRVYFFSLVAQKGGPTVNDSGMLAMRNDMVARGADFQNGWRGDVRPRIFLPVPGCPPATTANVPNCSFNRTVDLGNYGQPWQWIPRF
jgi:hypothetical protein